MDQLPLLRRVALLFLALSGACASFSTVRPAVVSPGPSLIAQASLSTPAGDAASWFYSYECASECSQQIATGELGLAFGRIPSPSGGGKPFTLGVGLNGFYPYAEGYLQLGRSADRPYGVGARVSVLGSWRQHQLYARVDRAIAPDVKLLWNPAILVHSGNSPNGANPGSIHALVNGFGLELGTGNVAFIPSISIVASRAQHSSYGREMEREQRVFATGSMGVILRRDPRSGR
jgi:hypothetical protein